MSSQAIKTAVFPVGGLGSRFLPATKASPKEMLPILDKPLIQFVVDEAISAGITRLVFITSYTKRAIEDYFDSNYELESRLEASGKLDVLKTVQSIIPRDIDCVYIRQPAPQGLGDAILRSQCVIGDEPFAVLLADDIIDSPGQGCLSDMVDVYHQRHANVIAIETVADDDVDKYGIVALDDAQSDCSRVTEIVEKPRREDAPSNKAVIGRYILSPAIFQYLSINQPGAGNEHQLTDAIALMMADHPVFAKQVSGRRFDCGSKAGMLKATMHFAMKDPVLRNEVESFLLACQSEY